MGKSVKEGIMPKESVRGVDDETVVNVGWSKERGEVQVATINHHIRADDDDPAKGWWIDLDRGGLNRLIKALRQARDDAFGRDE